MHRLNQVGRMVPCLGPAVLCLKGQVNHATSNLVGELLLLLKGSSWHMAVTHSFSQKTTCKAIRARILLQAWLCETHRTRLASGRSANLLYVFCFMFAALQELLVFARRRGWRVNLRPLAEIQTLAWLLVIFFIGRWMWALISSEGGLFGLDEQYYQEVEAAREQQRPPGSYHPQQQQPHWQQHRQ